jgi:hypothetical protein
LGVTGNKKREGEQKEAGTQLPSPSQLSTMGNLSAHFVFILQRICPSFLRAGISTGRY